MQFVLDRYSASKWQTDPTDSYRPGKASRNPDEELWRAHERCRERLVSWTRQTLKEQLSRRGASFDDITIADEVLDPSA